MKALVLESYNNLVYKEVDLPRISDNEVLVKVKACGICGSDVHGMDGSSGRRVPPLIMGHEASGVIEQAGKNVKKWKKGDRVTFDSTVYPLNDWYTERGLYNLSDNREVIGVSPPEYKRNGAFAEYVSVPEHILYTIPEAVSFEKAAMVEPVAVAAHAIKLADIKPEDSILVIGIGMIGLFIIQVLKTKHKGKIIALDLDDEKLKMAKQFGADHIINGNDIDGQKSIHSLTNKRGVDISFEVVGIESTVNLAVQSTRKGGSVILVGNLAKSINFPLQEVVTRQIRIQGSCAIAGEYPEVLEMIENNQVNVDAMISHIEPLHNGAAWFKKLYDKEPGLKKVILIP